MQKFRLISILILTSLFSTQSLAALKIAVASNFKASAQYIAQQFTDEYGIKVDLSSASTATLYQQILHAAPFDLFLAADEQHVRLLVDENKTGGHQYFLYAQGRLVFWEPSINRVPTLEDFMLYEGRLAMANPKFAPYGIAAQQTLESTQKWGLQTYVKGNNVIQAYQFVESKNAKAGLVSYASVIQQQQTHYVIIPQEWHQPITQAGVILNDKNLEEAILFQHFILSANSQNYIKSQGYN